MTKTAVQTIKGAYRYRLTISYVMLFACVLAVAWYMYCVFSIMSNSVEIGRGEAEISSAKREIAMLSSDMSKIESTISIAKAVEKGFKQSEVSMFILRNSDGEVERSLSYSNVTRQ